MRKTWMIMIWSLLGWVTLTPLQAQVTYSQNEARLYNDFIIGHQEAIGALMQKFGDTLSLHTVGNANAVRLELIEQIDSSIAAIRERPPFDKNYIYLDAAVQLFGIYKSIAENEYKELLEILAKPRLTQQDEIRYEEILNNVNFREMVHEEKFAAIQRSYAETYNLVLMGMPADSLFEATDTAMARPDSVVMDED